MFALVLETNPHIPSWIPDLGAQCFGTPVFQDDEFIGARLKLMLLTAFLEIHPVEHVSSEFETDLVLVNCRF